LEGGGGSYPEKDENVGLLRSYNSLLSNERGKS